jgi:cell wall-associated NlpC family hydrolase
MSRPARRPGFPMLRLRLSLLVCLLALTGFSAEAGSARTQREPLGDPGISVSRYARHFIGVPYRYGGASPRGGFDCSGFVSYVYRHFGVALPHYTFSQFGLGHRVSRRALAPGDLVFFDGLNHVGLYVGHGRFIHAPHTGARVRIERLRYGGRFSGARRLL